MAFVGPRRSLLFRPDTQREALAKILSGGQTAAWYQPGVGVTGALNASLWANWTSGTAGTAADLAQATGANQPIYLPWTGANYAYLPAVAANTLTSPNQVVTGSKTIDFDIALNDYTPAADVTLFDKTSGNDGFAVKWLTTDKIRLVIGDGVGLTNVDVVAASSFTDGSRHTATIAWADGVGATFSYDGVQSGSQVAAVKTLTNAAVVMTIGSTTSIGKVYRLQVGSLYDMNAALAGETTTNGATFTAATGEVWTLNNTGAEPAQIVGSPSLLFNGTAHVMQATYALNQPYTFYLVYQPVTWVNNATIVDGAIDSQSLLYQWSGGVDPNIQFYAGVNDVTVYNGPVARTYGINTWQGNGANGILKTNNAAALTANFGTNNMSAITLARRGNGIPLYGNVQIKELITRNVADSAATQLAIIQRLAALHGIAL